MKALIKKHLFDGKFEIQGEIAKGQTGTILYGYDIGLRQEVAIKIYHSQINGRLIRGKTFVEKSKPLLRLDHPNLLKIFKVEEEGDNSPIPNIDREERRRKVAQWLRQYKRPPSGNDPAKPNRNDTLSLEDARLILDAMRENETKFLQQLRKTAVNKTRPKERPDW